MIDAGGGYSANIDTSVPGLYTTPGAVVGTVPIASGGTGQTTAAAALAALGGVGAVSSASGDNGGNITISATSFGTPIQTAFKVTITVPTGSKAIAVLMGSGISGSGTTLVVGIDVDGAVSGTAPEIGGGVAGAAIPFCAMAVVTGDGNSHVFTPQAWKAGATNCTILNSGINSPPILVVLVVAAT